MIPTTVADAVTAIMSGDIGLMPVVIGNPLMPYDSLVVSALTGLSNPEGYTVTRKPVESGYLATDAATKEPRTVIMDICLADPDFQPEAAYQAIVAGNPASIVETWRMKRDKLQRLFDSKTLLYVQTHEHVFINMFFEYKDPIYDVAQNGSAYFCTCTFNEIISVATLLSGLMDQGKQALGTL